MRIALIGGGSVRTPLLVKAFCRSDLPLETMALYDIDRGRLEAMASIGRQVSGNVRIEICESSADAIKGADFVFASIRVGGIESRARDEAVVQQHGIAGQETVGPGGLAMAIRNAPPLLDYAREVERLAPQAWLVNFTNPVGLLTQLIQISTQAKVIGICDTPTSLFAEVVRALRVDPSACYFDYFGLNHLGWLREVFFRGEPMLPRLWGDRRALQGIYRPPLFKTELLAELRLLPTDYLYYYYCARQAFENTRWAGQTRGQVIERLNQKLFQDLAGGDTDPVEIYEAYIATREAGYLQIEAGASRDETLTHSSPTPGTGYHQIALAVVRAIHFDTGAILPVNVPNRGNFPLLQDDDVVEVPCVINANGPLPLHVNPIPHGPQQLMTRVKEYERLGVKAALSGSRDLAIDALARHPLVESTALATRLLEALAIP